MLNALLEMDSTGTIGVQSGVIQLYGGGTSSGAFTVAAGAELDFGGSQPFSGTSQLDNAGIVDVQSVIVAVQYRYTQTVRSVTKLDGGTIASSTALDIQGGLLDGNGTITGSVNNAGTISPGFALPGLITVSRNYTQEPSGQLYIELGGTTPGPV